MLTEGEEWTRAELRKLRAAGFRPSALEDFLRASLHRAGRVRRARPELAQRERIWIAIGAAAWLGLAALGVEPFRRRLGRGLGGWGVTAAMLDWHLGMLETPDGRPSNLGPADAATLLRAWLVPAVADGASLPLCAIGFATDALDGPLARITAPTRLGRDMEWVVDAAFVAAALRGARSRGRLSTPVVATERIRLALGFGYAVAAYFGRAHPPDARTLGAARAVAPIRAAALILAGAGRRKLGDRLLLCASAMSIAALARASAHGGAGR